MDTQLTVKTMQHQAWIEMVRKQVHSGLSVPEWCRQNGINKKTFWYRRRIIRGELIKSADTFVEVPVINKHSSVQGSDENPDQKFIPVMKIDIGKASISLSRDTPDHLLSCVLEAVRNA